MVSSKNVYSNQDPALEPNLLSQLMKQLRSKKSGTKGYNPKTNYLCEKSNGIVKGILLKYVNFLRGEWDKSLRELAYILNSGGATRGVLCKKVF